MSKLYEKYLECKIKDKNKIYIFKNGNFYLFLGEDAKIVNKELGLKLTKFCNESEKCGFPISEFDKYIKFITLLDYKYEVILGEVDHIINDIINININKISGENAISKIEEYQKLLTTYKLSISGIQK